MNFRSIRNIAIVATLAFQSVYAQQSLEDLNSVHDPNGHYSDVHVPVRTPPPPSPAPASRPEPTPTPTPTISKPRPTPSKTSFDAQIENLVNEMYRYGGIQTTASDLLYTVGVVVSENNTVKGHSDVITTIKNSSLYDECHPGNKFSYAGQGFLNPGAAARFPKRFSYDPSIIASNSNQTKLRVAREIADQYIEAANARTAAEVMDGPVADALYFNSMWLISQGGEILRHDFLTKREGHYFYTLDGSKNWNSCNIRELSEKTRP